MKSWFANLFNRLGQIGVVETDSKELKIQKSILTLSGSMIAAAGIIWGSFYFYMERLIAGILPFIYTVIGLSSILYFASEMIKQVKVVSSQTEEISNNLVAASGESTAFFSDLKDEIESVGRFHGKNTLCMFGKYL